MFVRSILFGVIEVAARLPAIFTAGILAKCLGTEAYGNWAIIITFQLLMVNMISLGIPTSISRIVASSDNAKASSYFRISFLVVGVITFFAAIFMIFFKGIIGKLLGMNTGFSELLVPIMVFVFITLGEAIFDAYFKCLNKLRWFTVFALGRVIIDVLILLYFFQDYKEMNMEQSVESLKYYIYCLSASKILFYSIIYLYNNSPAINLTKTEIIKFIKYGIPMIPSAFILWLATQGDRIIMAETIPCSELGIYAFGASLASYVSMLGSFIFPLLLPEASRAFDTGKKENVINIFNRSQEIFLWIIGLLWFALALFQRDIILLTAGESYIESAKVLLILGVALGIDQCLGIYTIAFHLIKKPQNLFYLRLVYCFIYLLLVLMAALWKGAQMVPWAILLTITAYNLILVAKAQQAFYIKFDVIPYLYLSI